MRSVASPSALLPGTREIVSNHFLRPMTLKTHCTPRDSVFVADRRATVLSLDTFLKG